MVLSLVEEDFHLEWTKEWGAAHSGALASRLLLLSMTESFLGREDRGLDRRLMAELPGILIWAIQGWKRLQARGEFRQPDSGQALMTELREQSSRISTFVEECCEVGEQQRVTVDKLYKSWKRWCLDQGEDYPGTKRMFGRELRTVLPKLATSATKKDGKSEKVYVGVGIRKAGDDQDV